MNSISVRKSWDTSVKHLARHEILDDVLSPSEMKLIPSSNISRWKAESDDKYLYCSEPVKERFGIAIPPR